MNRRWSMVGSLILTLGVWAGGSPAPAVAQSELCAHADGYAATACRLYCDALSCGEGEDDAQCRRLAQGYERATGHAPPCGPCTFAAGDDILCDFGLAAGGATTQAIGKVNSSLRLDGVTTFPGTSTFIIVADFTNIGPVPIFSLFFRVAELTGGNVLESRTRGDGGVGSEQDFSGVAAGGTVTVFSFIGLQNPDPFRFFVDAFGEKAPQCGLDDSKCVFVTSGEYTGDLVSEAKTLTGDMAITDGLVAGDRICQHLATQIGIGGTYKAWLSIGGGDSPDTRFFPRVTVPYVLVGTGEQVASSYADLVDGTDLANPIYRDETGGPLGSNRAWTNTTNLGEPGGGPRPATNDCSGWTTNILDPVGNIGRADSVTSSWTQQLAASCRVASGLYCFEQ